METDLENRQVVTRRKPEPPAADPLAARLEAARALVAPRLGHEHCGHCWGEGRDAALRVLEGG